MTLFPKNVNQFHCRFPKNVTRISVNVTWFPENVTRFPAQYPKNVTWFSENVTWCPKNVAQFLENVTLYPEKRYS